MASSTYRFSYGLLFASIVVCFWPVASANVDTLRASVDFSYYLGNGFLDFIRWGGGAPKKEMYASFLNIPDMKFSDICSRFRPLFISYVGYAVCLVLGVLFVVIMPLVGLFFCCCRCCGLCGGNVKVMDSSHAKCKRVFYTVCLALLNTVMLAGVVLAFINNQLLHETLANKDENVNALMQINKSLSLTDKNLQGIVMSVKNNSALQLQNESQVLRDIIGRRLDDIEVKFLKGADKGKMLESIRLLQSAVVLFDNYKEESVQYKIVSDHLSGSSLSRESNKLQNILNTQCQEKDRETCASLSNRAKSGLIINYDKNKMDLERPTEITDEVISNRENIKNLAKLGSVLSNISSVYKDAVQPKIDDLKKSLTESNYVKEAQDFLEVWVNRLRAVLQEARKALNSDVDGKVDIGISSKELIRYDTYRMYGFIAVCCLILFVVLFYYLGLCFGMCGERPFEDASLCNRGVGANLLMAGVAFAFFFSWILMIITMCLFVVGGTTQTELCRYATGAYPGGPAILDSYISFVQHENPISARLKNTSSQPVDGLLNRCRTESIMQSFNLTAEMFDTKEVFNKLVKPWLNEVKQVCRQVNPAQLGSYARTIEALKNNQKLQNVAIFKDYMVETSKSAVTMGDLNAVNKFISELQALKMPELQTSIDYLTTSVLKGQRYQTLMFNQFSSIVDLPVQLNILSNGITLIENNINTQKTKIVDSSVDEITKSIEEEIIRVLETLLSSVRCDKLHSSVMLGINAVCVTALYPFNGFWFGLGACLLLFIPTIIFAVKLAGLYRKTEKYCSDYEEPDYMSYQGFYINPGDNIPLERKSKQNKEKGRNNQRDANQRVNQRYQQLPVYPYDAYE